jgi:hypothetical protein
LAGWFQGQQVLVRVRRLRPPRTADRRVDPSRPVGCPATLAGLPLPRQISCARLRLVSCGRTPHGSLHVCPGDDGGVGRRVPPATPAPTRSRSRPARSRQRRERPPLGGRRGRLGMRSPVVLGQRDTCLAARVGGGAFTDLASQRSPGSGGCGSLSGSRPGPQACHSRRQRLIQRWRREASVPRVSCRSRPPSLVSERRGPGRRAPRCVWRVLPPPWVPGFAVRRPGPRLRSRPP